MRPILYNLLALGIFLIFTGCAQRETQMLRPVYYPEPPATPKIQFLASINAPSQLKQMTPWESFLLGPDIQEIKLGKTYDVAAAPGKIYTVDRNYKRVLVIDLQNKDITFLDDRQSRESQLVDPGGIGTSRDGRLYVADMGTLEVKAFDPSGKFLKSYGGKDMFIKPVDVAVFGDNIYVCDMKKSQIIVIDRQTGKHVKTIGELGPKETGLFNPTHISVDDAGNLYITDAFHFMLKKYSPEGVQLKIIGFQSDVPGAFIRPKGNAVSRDGYIYAVDAGSEVVQIFNQEAQLMLFFGGAGVEPGKLYLPAGITIDNDNVAYFSEFIAERFQVEYLILVSSLLGPRQLNIYGFGRYE